MDDLLSEFLTETAESLERLDVELVTLERNPDDPELLGDIFRLVHTIKGTCGFLDLPRLEAVAHAAENVLGRFRDGGLRVRPAAVSLILEAIDAIRSLLAALEATEAEPAGDDADLIARLDRAAAGELEGTLSGPVPAAEDGIREPQVAARSIRIGVDLLDELMTTVGELVLVRNQLLQMARNDEGSAYKAPLQRLGNLTTELQQGVIRTRMQPIADAWSKLPRIVRDLAVELDKKIELRMRGGETELDRQVLELIRDPLTHMVRNAADHGLERPAARVAAGKTETGHIDLSARHEGGHVIIEVSDDGAGIDVAKVKAKAVASGLRTVAEVAALTDRQARKLIFKPGFSTADSVTSVSGRGVGMDVVRANIERIGGTIEMKTRAGTGVTFVVKIPLTLAIIPALIVGTAGQRFAIPQINVVELVRVASGSGPRIERRDGAMLLRLRDRLTPVCSLAALLGVEAGATGEREAFAVVSQVGTYRFGLLVEEVLDTEEIVVKPVAAVLRDIGVYSGNTILGDGGVAMILDPNGLAAVAGETAIRDAEAPADEAAREAAERKRVAMIVFRAGGGAPKAVPLALVSRLEAFDRALIELESGTPAVRYRGQPMRLVPFGGLDAATPGGRQPVLVFTGRDSPVGLMVDEIVEIVDQPLDISLTEDGGGVVGTAVISGRPTEVIDASWHLSRAQRGRAAHRVLLVDDSAFFRALLTPLLVSAGYDVVAAGGADEAVSLCDAGERFDVILSDSLMAGPAFARALAERGAWRGTPLVALTEGDGGEPPESGEAAGFAFQVGKDDRDGVLDIVAAAMRSSGGAA